MPNRIESAPEPPPSSPEATRRRLLMAGLRLFGRRGFAGTSTRALAAEAGTNVASIAYHFGSKAGLHEACMSAVATQVEAIAGPVGPEDDTATLTPPAAEERLRAMITQMADFLVGGAGAEDFAGFVMRQIADTHGGADAIFERIFARRHVELCRLWAAITGEEAESEATRITAFTLIGQLVYFRIGQPLVLRRMGWEGTGPEQVSAITEGLLANLDAMIAHHRRSGQ